MAILLFFVFTCYNIDQNSKATPKHAADQSETEIQPTDSTEETVSLRNLKISATESTKSFSSFPPEELDWKLDFPLSYTGLDNVTIEINGKHKALEKAIRYGNISIEEISLYARLDAKIGVCTETYTSENGLTKFLYSYPEFDLKLVNDVYETPDGKQHLIRDIALYCKGGETPRIYTDPNTGAILDKEDWGISFSVVTATPTDIAIQCSQTNGQHVGELVTEYFYIVTADKDPISQQGDQNDYTQSTQRIVLHNNANTDFEIDWETIYGELPPGDYKLWLQIKDVYDIEDLHPLMKNYYDRQVYWIDFTIP